MRRSTELTQILVFGVVLHCFIYLLVLNEILRRRITTHRLLFYVLSFPFVLSWNPVSMKSNTLHRVILALLYCVIFALLQLQTVSPRLELGETQLWLKRDNWIHWNSHSFKFARWQRRQKGQKFPCIQYIYSNMRHILIRLYSSVVRPGHVYCVGFFLLS